jgi:hypothetical protein
MDKDVTAIGAFLVFAFIMSFVAHLLYAKGYIFDMKKQHMIEKQKHDQLSVFETENECEQSTGSTCSLKVCDDIPPAKDFEDICAQGFSEVWTSTTSR